ncbi:MAG: glycosyltransferase family 4 protein [bacterium]|nr:glycosyltransferase family 4 protein [bacterium]
MRNLVPTLFETLNGGVLYVLGDDRLPLYQREDRIEILRFSQALPNFLERTRAYGRRLDRLLDTQAETLRICQFRDPWGGIPILGRSDRPWTSIYEINGLPSIELPNAYPQLGERTLGKIRDAERFCWSEADRVITPSRTMRANLARLGVPEEKILVVPNGADVPAATPRPPAAPERYLIYVGALQRWQGVDVLLRALALLRDLEDLRLVVCAAAPRRLTKQYRKLAQRLEIGDRVVWFYHLSPEELVPWLAHAVLSVAPLTECPRNVDQGCFPLKILESMACGVPVVASDLPVVRELVDDGVDGKLVRPDRPSELARSIRVLLEYPDELRAMGEKARERVVTQFSWESSRALLAELYRSLSPLSPSNPDARPRSDRTSRKEVEVPS